MNKSIVVIPVKNDAKRLHTCLMSVANQVSLDRVHVIDNGSTDNSRDVAIEARCAVHSGPGLRVGALRNHAVRKAQIEFHVIGFVDSDHEVASDWLETGLQVLLEDETIVACGSHYLAPPNGTWVQTTWAIHRLRGPDRYDVDWLGAGNLFVRHDAFEKVGGFREDLIAAEDVDLCHRLRQAGGRIVCDKRIRNIHHGEPKTLLAFLRKEYWRGSSGVKAWVSQGYPLRDLPSFIWPLWHLIGGVILLAMSVGMLALFSRTFAIAFFLLPFLWILPSVLLSIRTCVSEKQLKSIPSLAVLYFVYGLARAAALFK